MSSMGGRISLWHRAVPMPNCLLFRGMRILMCETQSFASSAFAFNFFRVFRQSFSIRLRVWLLRQAVDSKSHRWDGCGVRRGYEPALCVFAVRFCVWEKRGFRFKVGTRAVSSGAVVVGVCSIDVCLTPFAHCCVYVYVCVLSVCRIGTRHKVTPQHKKLPTRHERRCTRL
jgi:hypothetical protein